MMLVAYGAEEETQDRSLCSFGKNGNFIKNPAINFTCTKTTAPKIPTKFGLYIKSVCGKVSLGLFLVKIV
jgi:hypothetical protein